MIEIIVLIMVVLFAALLIDTWIDTANHVRSNKDEKDQ